MAGGFLCFALVFCVLVQVAFWRLHNPTQVEDAMLDTYDLVYDRALRSPSSARRQELAAVQDTFLCCGKTSPSSLLGSVEADLCRGEAAATQGCTQDPWAVLWDKPGCPQPPGNRRSGPPGQPKSPLTPSVSRAGLWPGEWRTQRGGPVEWTRGQMERQTATRLGSLPHLAFRAIPNPSCCAAPQPSPKCQRNVPSEWFRDRHHPLS